MKRVKRNRIIKNAAKFVRIDPYTWIEKKLDEPDEVTRQRFLTNLSRTLNNPSLKPSI